MMWVWRLASQRREIVQPMRVPSLDPDRQRLIAHFEKKLEYFRRVPAHRRDAEAANEGEATCRKSLSELRVGAPTAGSNDAQITSIENWLDDIDREDDDGQG